MGNTWSSEANTRKEILWDRRTDDDQKKWLDSNDLSRNTNAAFSNVLPIDYPKFTPTLYFVDLTREDLNFSHSLANSNTAISKSYIYLKSQNNEYFHLTFSVKNPEFTFVRTRERPSLDVRNSKASQACTESINHRKKKKCNLNLNFHENELKASCSDVIRHFTTPISSTKSRNRFDGKIFIAQDEIQFVLPISGGLSVSEQFQKFQDTEEAEVRASNSDCLSENRASLLFNFGKNDLCRVNFEMETLKCTTVRLKTSRGIQADDPYTYIKTKTHSQKLVYIPIPITNYMYEDPRKKLRRISDYQMRSGIKPHWVEEVRKARVRQYREEACKLKKGFRQLPSAFFVQKGGHIIKMQTGVLRAHIFRGEHLYEEFVRSNCQTFGTDNTNGDITDVFDV